MVKPAAVQPKIKELRGATKRFIEQLKKHDPFFPATQSSTAYRVYNYTVLENRIYVNCIEYGGGFHLGDPLSLCVLFEDSNLYYCQYRCNGINNQRCFGNIFDLAEDKTWEEGKIVWDGHKLSLPGRECERCFRTVGVKKTESGKTLCRYHRSAETNKNK